MASLKKITHHPFFIRLFHWEYWPFNVVYGPIYIYWVWLFIRARSVFFFNASNPTIKNGGFLLESKKEIYDLLPPQYYPKTILVNQSNSLTPSALQQLVAHLRFPLVGKPDIGMQGLGVKKLENLEEVIAYARHSRVDFLLQEFVPYANEIGIFYYRYPNEANGKISGIVGKEFLTVTGNGKNTIEQLLQQDKRFILQLEALRQNYGDDLQTVLAEEEKYLLVPYGNHARGAKFLDLTDRTDAALTDVIDTICKSVPGFYYGRMDIRFESWEGLKAGRDFSIIELNGAGSEPTHMYDPRHSLFFAWKEIIRHWNILLRISMQNHRRDKVPYLSFASGWQMFRENEAYVKMIRPEKTPPTL